MKKFLSLLMALAMTLSLAACGGSKEEAPAETTDAPAETEASAEASSVPSGVEDGVLTFASVNGICGLMTLVILVVYLVNYLLAKREDAE